MKLYVMGSPGIDLFGIVHVKVGFIPVLHMYALPILGIFDLKNLRRKRNFGTSRLQEWYMANGLFFGAFL